MAWFDEIEPVRHPDGRLLIGASFRGVPFFVEAAQRTGGRRMAKHQFVDGEDPEVDDLGKVGNDFGVTGYVLGESYLKQKRQLMSALQDVKGPGGLVHPYDGRQRVQVGTVTVVETKSDGGMATFEIQFSHAPVRSAPSAVVDLNVDVVTLAADVLVSNSSNLEEEALVLGVPSFALASLSADLTTIANGLDDRLSIIATSTQELAKMSLQIDLIVTQAAALVKTPADMLAELLLVTEQLSVSIEEKPLEAVRSLLGTYGLDSPDAAIGDTETRIQERANQLLYADALRIVLISEAARIITEVDFESTEQATEARDQIVDALDALALTAGSTTYGDIVNLRSSVLLAIPGDKALASIVTITQHRDTPSLALSYRLYGNVDSAADLVARNNIAHPGYMSGSLSVLSDDD